MELEVSDEEFQSRIIRDTGLIETFFDNLQDQQNNSSDIDLSKVLRDSGIDQFENSNLYAYLSGFDKDTLKSLKDSSELTKDFEKNQATLRTELGKARASTIGLKLSTIALNAALNLGISLIVQGAVSAIGKLITSHQDAIDKAHELVATYSQESSQISSNIEETESLRKEFDKLSKGVDKYGHNLTLSTDEYERYRDIVEKIVEISPSLSSGYDEEGRAIANKNALLDRSIALQEEELRLKRENMVSTENLWDIVKGYRNEYGDYQAKSNTNSWESVHAIDDIAGMYPGEDDLTKSKQKFLAEYLGISDKELEKSLYDAGGIRLLSKKLADEIDEFYKSASTRPDIFSSDELQQLKEFISEREKYASILEAQNKKIIPILQEVPRAESEVYNNLGNEEKNFLTDYVNSLLIDLDNLDTEDKVEALKYSLVELTHQISNSPELQKSIENFYKIDPSTIPVDEYQKQIKSIYDTILKYLPENESVDLKASLNVMLMYDQDIDSLIEQAQLKVGDALDTLDGIKITDLKVILDPDFVFDPNSEDGLQKQVDAFIAAQNTVAKLPVSADVLSENFKTLEDATKEASSALSEYKSAVSNLNSSIEKLNEGTALSGSEMLDLIMTYPELASQIQVTNDGYQVSVEALKTLREQELQSAKDGIQAQIEKAKAVIDSTMSIVGAYGIQIESIKSLADAEAALSNLQTGLTGQDPSKFVFDDNGQVSSYDGSSLDWMSEAGRATLTAKVQAAQAALEIGKLYDKLNALQIIDPSKNFDTKNESSKDTWVEAYEKERAELDYLYKMELISAQEYYDGIDALRIKYFAGSEKYIDKERSILEELFDLQRDISKKRISDIEHEIYVLQQKEGTEEAQISKYKDIRDETNRQLKAAYDYGLDQHSEYVQELEKQWYDANQNIVEIYEDQLSKLEEKRDDFKSKQSGMLDEYLDVLDKEIEKLEERKKSEEEYWDEKIENFKKEHDELEKINDLEEKRLKLQNIKKQKNVLMYDKEKGWIRTYDHSAAEEAQKEYDKAVADKEYDDELDRMEASKDEAIKIIDDEIEKIEELKKTYQDSFDEINKSFELSADELKSLADFADMSREEQEEHLKSFVENYKVQMQTIVDQINAVKISAENAKRAMDEMYGYEGGSGSADSGSGYTPSKDFISTDTPGNIPDDYRIVADDGGRGTLVNSEDVTWRGEIPSQKQIDDWEKNGWKYAGNGGWLKDGKLYYGMGGVVEDTGMAKLHGDKVHSEVVFNAADAKKLYEYVHNTPNLIMDLSKKLFENSTPNVKSNPVPTQEKVVEQNFHIGQLSFPNATNAQEVIDAIRELPTFVMQKKFKR